MKTKLCDLLGIEHPIIAAPMGPDLTGPDLVAAVSNAGGLGILQAQLCPPPLFRQEIRRVRALTDRPFGVNLILHFPVEDQVAVCLEERVSVLSFFWGDPMPYVGRAHAAGVKVLHQVGSVAEAERAAAAGVDVIVAQGVEAFAFSANGGDDRFAAAKRMRAARLRKAADEGVFTGLEEDDAHGKNFADLLEDRRKAVEARAFAHIDDAKSSTTLSMFGCASASRMKRFASSSHW